MFTDVSSSRATCVDGIGDETVKSDRSVVLLHHYGLSRAIGFQQLSQTRLVESIQSRHIS